MIGRVLLGRYRVVRELAKGGMGVVYLARAEGAVGFVKPVVIKLILPDHARDARFVGMFAREAQILSHLRHPSIVDVLEFGEEDGAHVMVLEYVRGYHLGEWQRYLHKRGRELPYDVVAQILIDVLEALQHVHTLTYPDGTPMHIVHRDISPANILLDETGRGRLLDFGVARVRGSAMQYQTQVGAFMGKLLYTAPEICAGAEASPTSDLYGCAVVLHEMLLGHNTFHGDTQATTLHRVLNHAPDSVSALRSDVPGELDAVLRKALAKTPEARYADAAAFAAALRELQPEPESEVRQRLAASIRQDFGADMAELLGLDSLDARDAAWRDEPQGRQDAHPSRGAGDVTVTHVRHSPRRTTTGERVRASVPDGLHAEPLSDPEGTAVRRPGRKPVDRDASTTEPAANRPAVRAVQSPPPLPTTPVGSVAERRSPQPTSQPRMPSGPAEVSAPVMSRAGRASFVGASVLAMAAVAVLFWSLQQRTEAVNASFRIVTQPVVSAAAEHGAPEGRGGPPPMLREAAHDTTAEVPPGPRALLDSEALGFVATNADALDAQRSGMPGPQSTPHDRGVQSRKPRRAVRPKGPDAHSLTRAFRRQQPKVEACFTQHADALAGEPRIQLEFELDAAGQLLRAQVIPSSLAATPLGGCLQQVAGATEFPPQGQPVSFAIPVTASRRAALD